MDVLHITHPRLDPIEYYYCRFGTEKDIDNFTSSLEGLNKDDLDIAAGESWVIKHVKGPEGYYEKLPPQYFKSKIQKDIEIWSAVLQNAAGFFG